VRKIEEMDFRTRRRARIIRERLVAKIEVAKVFRRTPLQRAVQSVTRRTRPAFERVVDQRVRELVEHPRLVRPAALP
jgi:hypothetical protein